MARVVERNKLKWYEELYLPAIVSGLGRTFRQMFEPDITLQYPEERPEIHDDLVYGLAWSGGTLYTASGDKTIGVIDVASGETKRLEGHTGPVLAVAAHGTRLVSGGADGTLRVWEEGRLVRTISNHTAGVHALAFSADGETLASGSADRTVRIWRIEQGRLLKIIRGHGGTVTDLASMF